MAPCALGILHQDRKHKETLPSGALVHWRARTIIEIAWTSWLRSFMLWVRLGPHKPTCPSEDLVWTCAWSGQPWEARSGKSESGRVVVWIVRFVWCWVGLIANKKKMRLGARSHLWEQMTRGHVSFSSPIKWLISNEIERCISISVYHAHWWAYIHFCSIWIITYSLKGSVKYISILCVS